MASPQRSASVLLPLLILLLYWTTPSAQSHDPPSADLSALYRVKRDLAPGSKDQADKVLNTVKDSLEVFKDVMEKIDTKSMSAVIKGLASFASLAPGIGGLVSSVINMILVFIPQEDPVLKEVKDGFAEVNRKLDSLSIRLSNLATDVEWFNYASVYSQDEIRILNAWKKFNEFRGNSELVQSEDAKLRLAEIFTNYYENTAAEASVANFYHYLTVNTTSLGGNLNDLLIKKFKCGITEIGRYNIYFSSLLLKGMVLNQLYWNLIGFNSSGKEAEQAQMFKDVYAAQSSAVDFCKSNYEKYMTDYVVELAKANSPDNKQTIAVQVKNALDEKYSWYNWVVLVYNTEQDKNFLTLDMTKIPMAKITVAVGYTLKEGQDLSEDLKYLASLCFPGKPCDQVSELARKCIGGLSYLELTQYVKVTHVTSGEDFAQAPEASHSECVWDSTAWSPGTGKISMYYSRSLSVCKDWTCKNGGQCQRQLSSNEHLCKCPDGYYGDECEKELNIPSASVIDIQHPVPDISTIDAKLSKLEKKLEDILNTVSERCPSQ